MKTPFLAICFMFFFNSSFSQNDDYTREDYIKILNESNMSNIYRNVQTYHFTSEKLALMDRDDFIAGEDEHVRIIYTDFTGY